MEMSRVARQCIVKSRPVTRAKWGASIFSRIQWRFRARPGVTHHRSYDDNERKLKRVVDAHARRQMLLDGRSIDRSLARSIGLSIDRWPEIQLARPNKTRLPFPLFANVRSRPVFVSTIDARITNLPAFLRASEYRVSSVFLLMRPSAKEKERERERGNTLCGSIRIAE